MVDSIIIVIGIGIVTEAISYFKKGVVMVPKRLYEDGCGVRCRGVHEIEKAKETKLNGDSVIWDLLCGLV